MHTTSYFILLLCLYLSNGLINDHYNNQLCKSTEASLDYSSVETKWINQPIDHFNSKDTRIWQMRYFMNMEKWKKGGPVYIFIGGAQALTPCCLITGLMYELAEETHGFMIATEHRYYGKSKPFNEVTNENIHYLTSEQALADLENLITRKIKNKPAFKESKVVVVGGSYAGNLAAWIRQRRSDLVDAAVSSSAPVLAKLDFKEFLGSVGKAFSLHAEKECLLHLTNTFKSHRNDLKSDTGMDKLKNEHKICKTSDLSKLENQAEFFEERVHKLIEVTQNGTPKDIEQYCEIPTTRFCKKSVGCCNLEFDHLYSTRSPTARLDEGDFWTYQMCNEFGYFFTAPKAFLLKKITLNVDYSIKICSRLFGEKFTKEYIEDRIKETNSKYGGLNPKVTNVIFVHGKIDPWRKLGIVKDLSGTAPARVILGASHCNDLYSNEANTTTKAVKRVKKIEKKYIKEWIGFNN